MATRRWSSVSRHILFGIVLQLLTYSVVSNWWFGFGVWASILLSVALVIGVRCLFAISGFLIVWGFRPEHKERIPLSARQVAAMIVREVGASIKLFFYYHPFEALLNSHNTTVPIAKDQAAPVLFVHGFYANAGFWLQFKRYLNSRGMGALYTMNLDPPIHDIETYAGLLAQRITEVCAHSGRQKIVLVAHSMGGLVCRAYVARYGDTHIAQLITIGCPHHGTILARLLPGHNMKQMHPGNRWLKELNAKQEAPALSTYFSLHDNIVVPQDSARFAGAREVVFNGLGHLSMAFSPDVQRAVLDDIRAQKLDKVYL